MEKRTGNELSYIIRGGLFKVYIVNFNFADITKGNCRKVNGL